MPPPTRWLVWGMWWAGASSAEMGVAWRPGRTGITWILSNRWPGVAKSVLSVRFHDPATPGCAFCFPTFSCHRAGIATSTVLPVHPDKVIPDIYINLVAAREREIVPGLFVKTHESFDRPKSTFPPRPCTIKHVYIFRSPEDALVSFYRYHLREENLKDKVRRGQDYFCRTHVRDWMANAASYARAAQHGAEVFFVSYEGLLDQTGPVLSGILDWLGVDYQEAMVQRAVSHMQFGNLRMEAERARASRGEFSGRGGPGAGAAELEAATLARIRKEAAGVMDQANRLLSSQNQMFGNRPRATPSACLAPKAPEPAQTGPAYCAVQCPKPSAGA